MYNLKADFISGFGEKVEPFWPSVPGPLQQLRPKKSTANFSKTFAKLVLHRKINAALRLLSDETSGGVLPLFEEVFQSLREKHPSPAEIKSDSLLHDPIADLSNVSVAVDERDVLAIAKTLKGAAGPSGLDC